MAKVVIYTKPGCPYCSTAIDLLKRKGVDFDEVVEHIASEVVANRKAAASW